MPATKLQFSSFEAGRCRFFVVDDENKKSLISYLAVLRNELQIESSSRRRNEPLFHISFEKVAQSRSRTTAACFIR